MENRDSVIQAAYSLNTEMLEIARNVSDVGEVYRQPVSRGNVSDHSRLHKALRSNFRKHALSTRPHPGRCHGRALAA